MGELWGRKNLADRLSIKKKDADVRGKIRFRGQKSVRDCILVDLIGELESFLSKCLRLRLAHQPKEVPARGKSNHGKMKFFESFCSYIMQKTKI